MLRLGLTGGIGSGKSTVAAHLRGCGALVVDADAISREVVQPGTAGLAAVTERFGADVLAADGSLDRAALSRIVFSDDRAREDLEAIVHPLVAARRSELVEQADDQIVVYDVPLLVEKRMGADYHLVIVVDAPAQERVTRLVEQRGMRETEARARMEHQASDEERRRAADILLDNSRDRQALTDRVDELWRERFVPYDDNLRAQRRYKSAKTPILVDYDPTWPQQAERAMERISRALGERAPEIEHVGSTSVPGLQGRDVIDLQLGVPRLQDADDPDFIAALADLGFPRSPNEAAVMDRPKALLPDPSLWIKRFHGSCDPGRVIHLHVREIGSAGWQYALLYRDWLRDDDEARADYLAHKQRLAATTDTSDDYREAKEPWFDQVWPRMQAWARRTGWHD